MNISYVSTRTKLFMNTINDNLNSNSSKKVEELNER